ncbi:MAG TPA: amidohydrolase [SAR86 cluster bacterium]|nr:amidohydrolase [SAR86 cluster bacterium]HJM59174.1 amidohydrolase [SAR86 cluster bacterium]|tara:strand:- start:8327 stop:9754 length:1428 start_codon:yes stop_codon:yes gene_type:complete
MNKVTYYSCLCLSITLISINLFAERDLGEFIDKHQNQFEKTAIDIWDYAEVGYQEYKSSELLKKQLLNEGFSVTSNIANIPTAFVAEYGKGFPIIAILGEFDALPGVAQSSSPFKEAYKNNQAGHACGHHLFGAGSAWASVAIKEWLKANNQKGTIRFYGTPAEEGGSGKVYMAREGIFNDVDVILHWHPGSVNHASPRTSNANKSAKFRFKGISTHAAGAPEKGRSALDGVESMNMMVNLMREHVPQESRIHYVITKGGLAPNVIPDEAEVYYYVRHPKREQVNELFNRVVKAAEGAALGTETDMTFEIMHGNYSLMPNDTLQKIMHQKLTDIGGTTYSPKENEYAKQIYETLLSPKAKIGDQENILPYKAIHGYGSTDVGDVSWLVPTAGARIATWVPGTSSHSWQAVASGGTTIGLKGTKLAVQVLSETAKEIYLNPSITFEAKKELNDRVGKNFKYIPLLGNREPPLDYRN